MQRLPRASGDKHVAAFKRAGFVVNHIEGSHYIMVNWAPQEAYRESETYKRGVYSLLLQ